MRYFTKEDVKPAPEEECTIGRLTLVLRKLAELSPFLKKSLRNACVDCVLHDGKIVPAEARLLRATAASLDCPMPPLLAAGKQGIENWAAGPSPDLSARDTPWIRPLLGCRILSAHTVSRELTRRSPKVSRGVSL